MFRRCSAVFRRCSALFRPVPALFRPVPALFRPVPALFRRCSALFRRCSALFRRVPPCSGSVPVFRITVPGFSTCRQNDSVPSSLLCLVSMLLNGPNITDQDTEVSQACFTIAQLIVYNAKKSASPVNKKPRHSHEREPPLPIYIGLNVHAQIRSRKLVDNLYHMGLSVSYSRIDELANRLATAVCNMFKADGVVCPVRAIHCWSS